MTIGWVGFRAGSAAAAATAAAPAIKYSVDNLDDTDGPRSPVSPEQTRDGGIRPPPEDISGLITSQLLAEMGGSDWKARAAALEAVRVLTLRTSLHLLVVDSIRVRRSNQNGERHLPGLGSGLRLRLG